METHDRPLAVITEAASGIGFELSRVFAENGFDLLITGAGSDLLRTQWALRRSEVAVSVEAHQADLATEAGVIYLCRQITNAGRPVEALALNAGAATGGGFATETSLDEELRVVDLNVRSTVHLCKLLVAEMVKRDRGRILFCASAGSGTGAPRTVYEASEAFVSSFALGLRDELRASGVIATSLVPGPGPDVDPAGLAKQGFDALMAGKDQAFAGSAAENEA